MMKRRRQEHKTDYRLRRNILKSGKPRIVFRKTNSYVLGQMVESISAQDKVLVQAHSRELLRLGWDAAFAGSLKSLPACYLTGLLLGKRIKEKYGEQEVVLDIGLLRNKPKSRIYAFVKGIVDVKIPLKVHEDIFPLEERIKGSHMKKDVASLLHKISKNIEAE